MHVLETHTIHVLGTHDMHVLGTRFRQNLSVICNIMLHL
jgi:hypothetical protein